MIENNNNEPNPFASVQQLHNLEIGREMPSHEPQMAPGVCQQANATSKHAMPCNFCAASGGQLPSLAIFVE